MIGHYVYWGSTVLLSLLYAASALLYIARREDVEKAQKDLGYSATLLVPFMIAVKILGPAAVMSRFSVALSDLAYAGMLFHLILSALAHLGVRKPKAAVPAFLGLVLLVTSFVSQNLARVESSPYAPYAAMPTASV